MGPAVPPGAHAFSRGPVTRFFLSVFLSLYGDWLTTVALVVLLYELTGSPAGPAGYLLARVAPRVVGPWIGGSLADRLSPRVVMIVASLVQGAFTASLVVSDRTHTLWTLYAAVAAAQFTGALARPSQGALLPSLVSATRLQQANAVYSTLLTTAIFAGPAIGAVLLLRTGPDVLFFLDALSFLVAAGLAVTFPSGRRAIAPPLVAEDSVKPASVIRLASRDPVIRLVSAANFGTGLTVTVAQAVLVVAARERFGNDAAVGVLYSTVGIGGTIGGLLAMRWRPPLDRIRLVIYASAIGELVFLALFAAAPDRSLGLAVLGFSTLASAGMDVWGMTEIQRRAPPGYTGRFNAIPWATQYAGMLVGAVWALATTAVFRWQFSLELACLTTAVVVSAAAILVRETPSARARERS